MLRKQIKLLESLIKIPSPSGFENTLAQFLKKELSQFLPRTRVKIDAYNNVIAIIKGKTNKKIMIDAHLDEIGFIVTNVDRNGLISIQYIGGGENQILPARYMTILTSQGNILAVTSRKHGHLVKDEEEERLVYIKDLQLDIGSRGRKKVLSRIKIGDPIVYTPYFKLLINDKHQGQYIAGYGMDDKTGCYILIQTIKTIVKTLKKSKINNATLIFTFSTGEEIGRSKTKSLIKQYNPDLFIEVDVTFATDYADYYDDEIEREVGRCELGKGIVLYRGVDICTNALKLLESISKYYKIRIQYQASTGSLGYIHPICTKGIILGIPLRNMHTPTEVINLKDLKYGIDLLTNFLLNKRIHKIL